MKDLTLSLLSRGCGHVVHTEEDSQGGRLEVCFEPEDYFNSKSRRPVLRLSPSGRIHNVCEPAPPKTYTTRRGPLLLYSEDLALLPIQGEDAGRRPEQPSQRSRQDKEFHLHPLRQLRGATLSTSRKKRLRRPCGITLPPISSKLMYATSTKPLYTRCSTLNNLDVLKAPQPAVLCETQSPHAGVNEFNSKGQLPNIAIHHPRHDVAGLPQHREEKRLPDVLPPLPGREVVKNANIPPTDNRCLLEAAKQEKTEMIKTKETLCLRIVLEAPRAQMSPVPEEEFTSQEENSGNTLNPKEEWTLQRVMDRNEYSGDGVEHGGRKPCAAEMLQYSMKTAYVDSSWDCSPMSRVNYYGGHLEGSRGWSLLKARGADPAERKQNILQDPALSTFHLPPLPMRTASLPRGQETTQARCEEPVGPEPCGPIRLSHSRQSKAANRTLLVPLLVSPHTQHGSSPEPHGGLCHHIATDGGKLDNVENGQSFGYTKAGGDPYADKSTPVLQPSTLNPDCLGLLEPGEGERLQPAGMFPPLLGHIGPGKQSCMAFYRYDPDDGPNSAGVHDSQTEVVKGSLPTVLREWRRGNMVGTLIMGPDGEIIRLSMWNPDGGVEEHHMLDDITQRQAFSKEFDVITSGALLGQSWTILHQTGTGQGDVDESALYISNTYQLTQQSDDRKAELQRQKGASESKTGPPLYSGSASNIASSENTTSPSGHGDKVYVVHLSAPEDAHQNNRYITSDTPISYPAANSRVTWAPILLSGQEEVRTKPAEILPPYSEPLKETGGHRGPPIPEPAQHIQQQHGNSKRKPKTSTTTAPLKTGQRWESEQRSTAEDEEGPRGSREDEARGSRKMKQVMEEEKTARGMIMQEETSNLTLTHTLKKRKTKVEKAQTAHNSNTEPAAGVKKNKVKGQAEFVVGKPRKKHGEAKIKQRLKVKRPKASTSDVHEDGDDLEDVSNNDGAGMEYCEDGEAEEWTEREQQVTGEVQGLTEEAQRVTDRLEESCEDLEEYTRNSEGLTEDEDIERKLSSSSSRWSEYKLVLLEDESPRELVKVSHVCLATPVAVATESRTSSSIKKSSSGSSTAFVEMQKRAELAAALARERAEQRRVAAEKERKKKEEEEQRRIHEREEREERIRLELLEEQQLRAEELRLRKQKEKDEHQKQEEEERERVRRKQAEREAERRRQEERSRHLQRLHRIKQEEQERRAAELERQRLEQKAQEEEEERLLQNMDETERKEYLHRKQEEEEERQRLELERRKMQEEADLWARQQAEKFVMQYALLDQELKFQKGLLVEAEAMDLTQDISRPWVYSYFTLLDALGVSASPTAAENLA